MRKGVGQRDLDRALHSQPILGYPHGLSESLQDLLCGTWILNSLRFQSDTACLDYVPRGSNA